MIAGISGVPRLFVLDEIPSFAKAFDDVDPEERMLDERIDEAGGEGHELGEDCREGRAGDTLLEKEDAGEVEGDVEDRRADEEEQRGEGIADAMEDAHHHVAEDLG